ncbi:tRNA(Ile)-lysidine synthase [Agaricicola taiwanensis]|uniref:tRNA(Ile)-lysidine synthase n=1 Tax=Agaricicola taiwanensis TaxID=591372 RepID=A0A8J2VRV2_9RHOB|nr:tRNA lysidine(34) synthetase TilS [Agaricicola taiwanensis]GGE39173.1 tRNA(Ile)-lysidine synthase [Agaricicola taiwanensis]
MSAAEPSDPVEPQEAARLFEPLAGVSVLVALSGGADSVALLWLLWRWGGAGRLIAATVDHGLREGSHDEAVRAGAFAASLDVPHAILSWRGNKPETGIEAEARAARYALLEQHMAVEGAGWLVTAHTLDDQAETVLLRLAAGSGPSGLRGMRRLVKRSNGIMHLRPLLQVPKSRLVKVIQERGIPWSEDPMNADPAFARARLRRSMDVLAREGLTNKRLAILAQRMGRMDEAVEAAVDQAWARHVSGTGGDFRIAAEAFGLPEEITLRLLRRALASNEDILSLRLDRLEALAGALRDAFHEGASLVKTLAGMRVALTRNELRITPAPPRRPRSPS